MPDMTVSRPSVTARHLSPAVGLHQLRPPPIKLPMIAFADAKVAGPSIEVLAKALVPEAHLRVRRHPPRSEAPTGAGAFLPVVHVVLLEGAGRAEPPHSGQAQRL